MRPTTEYRQQNADYRQQMTDDRSQRAEDRIQMTEDRSQRADGRKTPFSSPLQGGSRRNTPSVFDCHLSTDGNARTQRNLSIVLILISFVFFGIFGYLKMNECDVFCGLGILTLGLGVFLFGFVSYLGTESE